MNSLSIALRLPGRTLAIVLVLALLAWTTGLPSWLHKADAAGLTLVRDVLNDSDLSALSQHSVTFTTATSLAAGEFIRITLDPAGQNFNFNALAAADVASSTSHTVSTVIGSCGAGVDFYVNSVNSTSDYVEYVLCPGDTLAGGTLVNFRLGNNIISNPATALSYVVNVKTSATSGGTAIDEADTRVAIIDDVTVTAAVDTIFTFSINGVAGGVTVNDDVTTTAASSTATTVPFGILAPGTPKLMAQKLLVDTNALNGFSVTVQADTTLIAGNGATIDEFIDNSAVASTTPWVAPAGTMGSPDTYGHWGVTSDDNVVSSTTPNKWGSGYALYQGNFTANNPVEVFYHNAAVQNTAGMGVGSTTVAYKAQITALQEAAKDYTATLTYIATPVF
jgi:hypothetical protein